MATTKKPGPQTIIVRTLEDFDRLAPPSPSREDEEREEEDVDPAELGRRLGRQILRDAFAPLQGHPGRKPAMAADKHTGV